MLYFIKILHQQFRYYTMSSDIIDKQVLRTVVAGITSKIEEAQMSNGGKIPYGCVVREIAAAAVLFPNVTVTRDQVNNALRRRKKKRMAIVTAVASQPPTRPSFDPPSQLSFEPPHPPPSQQPSQSSVSPTPVPKVGRKTDKKKRSEKMNLVAARNEVCSIYSQELQQHKADKTNCRKYFPTGRLDLIIKEVKDKRNISEDVIISKKLIRKRILKNKLVVLTPSGPDSPLAAIEPKLPVLSLLWPKSGNFCAHPAASTSSMI